MTQPKERIREQRVLRSATAVTDATQTTIYLATCDVHQVPVRESKLGLYPHLAPKHSRVLCFIGGQAEEHEVLGEKLIAVETTLDCDGQCRSARGRSCSCGCGGTNHGDHWTRQYMLDHREMFESEVAKYRYELQQIAAKRVQRKQDKFETWMTQHADAVEFFMNEANIRSSFLRSMKEQLSQLKPLSEGQLRVVLQIRQEEAEGRARWQVEDRRRQEREARAQAQAATRRPGQGDQSQLTIGVYRLNDQIYVLTGNMAYKSWRKHNRLHPDNLKPRPNEAKLYAKVWVRSPGERIAETGKEIFGRLEYAPGVVFKIAPSDRMSLEDARDWTQQFSQCVVCGARLELRESIERGMGATCAGYFA